MMLSVSDLVATARGQVENLTPVAVAGELTGESDVVLIDVREPGERETHGVIAGAVHVPRGMLEFCADPASPAHHAELRRDRRVILHCASGGRSALAAVVLRDMGYRDVAHLDGGLNSWRDAGLPVDRP
jgi:rhodanese-related sulfurtransferase